MIIKRGFNLDRVDRVKRLERLLKSEKEREKADAAVVILLKKKKCDFEILFVKRAVNPIDPWSGEMAFPGGRSDHNDRDIKNTIVRETFEETGIDLLHRCRFLGTLEFFRSTRNQEMKILPFIVIIEYEPSIVLNKELVWFEWIFLEKLIQHETVTRIDSKEVPAFIMEKCIIWGLTYRILKRFIYMVQSI
jgi:8-oxo-dGTP pyrophosphatase MutT (NUDIX family)